MPDHIGEWVKRTYQDRRYHDTRFHLVETKVTNSYITKCGVQLNDHAWLTSVQNDLVFEVDPHPSLRCFNCFGRYLP